jgi:hypothetical protein
MGFLVRLESGEGLKFKLAVASWLLSKLVSDRLSLTKLITALLAVFFQLLYNQFAWTYNFVAYTVSSGLWFHWVDTALLYLDRNRSWNWVWYGEVIM